MIDIVEIQNLSKQKLKEKNKIGKSFIKSEEFQKTVDKEILFAAERGHFHCHISPSSFGSKELLSVSDVFSGLKLHLDPRYSLRRWGLSYVEVSWN